ncbi:MAG: hybrid sensor histidine kinase/response regulator [Rickettsiales bacterium]|nr:hybrid sensor histidine kinase/response regulator [Rickettsiales bacterium]
MLKRVGLIHVLQRYSNLKKLLKYCNLKKILKFCDERVANFGAPYHIFAIFGIINYPLAYFIRVYIQGVPDLESFFFRVLATILCVILFFRDYWPEKLKKYLSLYWYVAVTVSIPMHIGYLLIKNNFSLEWIINTAIGLLITLLVIDWLMFLICMFIGTCFGYLIFILQYGFIEFQVDSQNINIAIYLYSMIILFCVIFAGSKDQFHFGIGEVLRRRVSKKTQELEKSLAVKERFLNFVSHEIKGPVHVVDILANDLLDQYNQYSKKKISDSLKHIAENTQKLAYLVNDWIDVSSISRDSEFDMRRVNLLELIKNMIQDIAILAHKKNITVSLSDQKLGDIEGYQIVCDKYRIEQVFSNVCMNAIKFSPENSTITVDIYSYTLENAQNKKVNGLCVATKDQGKGIEEKDLNSIFELFVRGDKTDGESVKKGLGLGLALAKKIIDRHDGKIWVENNQNSRGSTFYFFIPFGIQEEVSGCQQNMETIRSCNILFIDDEELCCASASILLTKLGHKVETFTKVDEFFKYLKSNYRDIDMIFVDIMMPISGVSVISEIRADKKYNDIAIIAQSGVVNNEELNKLFALGKVGFVSKPYNGYFVRKEINKMANLIDNYTS